jgi:hypothetical protein
MAERVVNLGEITIEWAKESKDSAIFGRVMAPVQSEIFAAVGRRLDGRCGLTLSPRGRSAEYSTYRHAVYLTPEKAMVHAERWIRSRWRNIPLFVCKISQAKRPESLKPRV